MNKSTVLMLLFCILVVLPVMAMDEPPYVLHHSPNIPEALKCGLYLRRASKQEKTIVTIDLESTYWQNWSKIPDYLCCRAQNLFTASPYVVNDNDILALLIVLSGIYVKDTSLSIEPFNETWGADHWYFLRTWALKTREKKINKARKSIKNFKILDLAREEPITSNNNDFALLALYHAVIEGLRQQNISTIILSTPLLGNTIWCPGAHSKFFEILRTKGIAIEAK